MRTMLNIPPEVRKDKCPYCKRPLNQGAPISRDHINPRHRGGTLIHPHHTDQPIGNNFRYCHLSCNNLKERAGDCPGALFCAIAVADTLKNVDGKHKRWTRAVGAILRQWQLQYKEPQT